MEWGRRKNIFTNHDLITYLLNDKVVYRTAPVTPGLLKKAGLKRWETGHCNAMLFSKRLHHVILKGKKTCIFPPLKMLWSKNELKENV